MDSVLITVDETSRSTAPDQDLQNRYLKNLAALYRCNPGLASQIDALPFRRCPRLEATRDKNVTARLMADNDKPIYVHSRYRPLDEARKFIEAQQRGAAEDEQSAEDTERDDHSFLIGGLGLGYHLCELERQKRSPALDRGRG